MSFADRRSRDFLTVLESLGGVNQSIGGSRHRSAVLSSGMSQCEMFVRSCKKSAEAQKIETK